MEYKEEASLVQCQKNICSGSPCIIGTRLTVYNIVTRAYLENDIEIVLQDMDLTIDQMNSAIDYCLNMECKNDPNRINYCDGCILREDLDSLEYEPREGDELMFGWKLAQSVFEKTR